MESVARLTSAERRELFAETAARRRMTPAIVEKDSEGLSNKLLDNTSARRKSLQRSAFWL